MIPYGDTFAKYFEFVGALSVLAGLLDWTRKGSVAEDEVVVAATDLVLETLSNADTVERTACVHHRNMRDAVSVEEAENMAKEAELRRFGWSRN